MSVAQFTAQDRAALHAKLNELLDQAEPENVRSIRVAAWDGIIKNAEGEAEIVRQSSIRLESANISPAWPPVQAAAPVRTVTVPRPRQRRRRDHQVAVILPDPQIGYRLYEDTGEYDPFHDERAIDVALQIVGDLRPDLVIWLGDFLDLPDFGKYEQEPAFARTTQRAIDYGHELLARTRALAPRAEHRLLEGNHDARLQKMIARNAMAAAGLRRAGESWPALSVPALLRLDELGVECVGGYPAGESWINDRLKCIHGVIVRSGGGTARAVADDETTSVIHGHIHRIETAYKTVRTRAGGQTRVALTPGCLCRIDGAVPSAKGATDLSGRPVRSFENWQLGLAVVRYQQGGGNWFDIDSIHFDHENNYRAFYGGTTYTA